ncbi:MAG: hypothetical protein ACYC3X_04125 [Pirellulaceae bacterium]
MMLTVGMSGATGIRRCIAALSVLVGCVAACDTTADAADHEILKWHPGSHAAPQPSIRAERFKNNDLGIESADFFGQHAPFGSVVAYFCGDDVDLRREFAKTFEKYLVHRHDGIFPGSTRPQDGNCTIHTYRTSIDMLRDERFTGHDPALTPVLQEGDSLVVIPDGGLPRKRVRGSLDLTRFYVLSRQQECFPGQKCQAGDAWVGFEGDDPQLSDPQERHGIEWIGFIFENHGPFRVQAAIHELNVREVGP